jgi:hypothetical protein
MSQAYSLATTLILMDLPAFSLGHQYADGDTRLKPPAFSREMRLERGIHSLWIMAQSYILAAQSGGEKVSDL